MAHRYFNAQNSFIAQFLLIIISALFLFIPFAVLAQDKAGYTTLAKAQSPNKTLNLLVLKDAEGHIFYTVDRFDEVIIAPSKLGFILADAKKLDRYFEIISQKQSTHDTQWQQPWGENKTIRDSHTQLVVNLHQPKWDNRKLDIVFRIFDDSVGFRYIFPEQPELKTIKIVDELTEFSIKPESEALWINAGEWNRYEYLYERTPLKEVGTAHTPITMKTHSGLYIAIHEAALVDYASMWLRKVTHQTLKARLSPSSSGPSVIRTAPFSTPWRTIIIAKNVTELYGSNISLNLNEPNKLGDTSYFTPHKYIGIWWEMHINKATWEAGPRHGATTKNTKKYIDFAAKHGFKGVLVEGWNLGWEDWFATGDAFDFTTPYPDFDMKVLSAYGRKKGVAIVGHHETSANIGVYEPQLDAAMAYYSKFGINTVKTGYVADAGGVQTFSTAKKRVFEWHDGQIMSRHHLMVVESAHKYKIAINPHEPIKDTGLRRTYPNWVSREGARGMEYNAWGNPSNPPEHEVNLVYTRMLSGPMDYTPGILSLTGSNQPIQSTQARQLALYIALYSPIQMAADLPENYEKYPKAFQFIKDVAVDWEKTTLIDGELGDYAAFVRKDRHSDDWYYGAITDENARDLTVDLSFLETNKTYVAEIYRDGPHADFIGEARFDIEIFSQKVTSKDTLNITLARGGGTAIRFIKLKG